MYLLVFTYFIYSFIHQFTHLLFINVFYLFIHRFTHLLFIYVFIHLFYLFIYLRLLSKGTRISHQGLKWPRSRTSHSHRSITKIKEVWSYISTPSPGKMFLLPIFTPSYTFMTWWCRARVRDPVYMVRSVRGG
jgi:hypothetical protein